ncbi:type II toxin-antitoxin system RelE/ParE family toxin [Flavobacterium sp.]|uniref:type II toxin-antitoxin system RelE/ParE family toxin n=1 Tax=Flavobacterium sp. TaxID=239 RepID=UPI004048165F
MIYKKLIVKPIASVEIEESLTYYLEINKKLSQELEIEVRDSFTKILNNPENFQLKYQSVRVVWLKKFPYGIYYIYDTNEIYVIAFWHTKQDVLSKLSKR